jgi:hypothetical protein
MRDWTLLVPLAGIALVLAGVPALAGAGGPTQERSMSSHPDFVGWVMAIEPGDGKGALGRIVVESQADKIVRRLVVTVTSDTQIYRRTANDIRRAGFKDVARRDQARLWLTGPVPRSFPAQVIARKMVVERLY